MSDNDTRLKESLSAVMDGSADELELQRVLKATAENDELRATWERYQLASSAMRNEAPVRTMDLSASISAAIADEPAHKSNQGVFKNLSRVAIAASVTLAIVVGVQQVNQSSDSAVAPQVAASNSANVAPLPSEFSNPIDTAPVGYGEIQELVVEPLSELDEDSKKELEQRLNELLKEHTEDAALDGGQGLLPHARLPEEKSPQGK
ncbi:anti-sigma factor [bacterium SCSIO 12696]|nr:anti-sigma factor [bacterium SCSIO 12696]